MQENRDKNQFEYEIIIANFSHKFQMKSLFLPREKRKINETVGIR